MAQSELKNPGDAGRQCKYGRPIDCTEVADRPFPDGEFTCRDIGESWRSCMEQSMGGKRQFSLRAIFVVMILVAHASAKPHFAKSLHPSISPSAVTTIFPFLITIGYEDDDGSARHEETFAGLLGMYWLTSRTSYSCCWCCFGSPLIKSEDELTSDEIQKMINEHDLKNENEDGQNVDSIAR